MPSAHYRDNLCTVPIEKNLFEDRPVTPAVGYYVKEEVGDNGREE
jgi:hypothetical protein